MSDKSNPHSYSIDSGGDAYDAIDKLLDYCESEKSARNRMDEHTEFIKALAVPISENKIDGDEEDGEASTIVSHLGNKSNDMGVNDIKYDLRSELNKLDDSQTKPLNDWLWDNVDYINVTKSNDTNTNTKYTWYMKNGDVFTTEREQNNWSTFAEVLTDVNFMYDFTLPENKYKNGSTWSHKFMKKFLRKKINSVDEYEGSRTSALESIRNTISSRKAFTNKDDAYSNSGLYVEGDYVYILNKIVKNIAEDYAEESQNLQIELKKNRVIDGKVSHGRTLENGQRVNFWKLPKEFAEPKSVEDEGGDEEDIVSVTGRGEAI